MSGSCSMNGVKVAGWVPSDLCADGLQNLLIVKVQDKEMVRAERSTCPK